MLRTMTMLRENNFDVINPGEHEELAIWADQLKDNGVSAVFIMTEPDKLVSESKRLHDLMVSAGISFTVDNDEDPWIEANYCPIDNKAFIVLANMHDDVLSGDKFGKLRVV